MARSYPRRMPPKWLTIDTFMAKYRTDARCTSCGRRFQKGDRALVTETQVNWFRGDDESEYLCDQCAQGAKGAQKGDRHGTDAGTD